MRRWRTRIGALASVAALAGVAQAPAWSGVAAFAAEGSASGTAIVIDPGQVLRPISRDLFGFNSETFSIPQTAPQDQGSPYDATNGTFNAKFVQEVRDAHPSDIRYPFGTPANYFNWKEAIGPRNKRGCTYVNWLTAPDPLTYGPDEHMQFVNQVGAQANIVVNANSGTPQDAADWVEYMNARVGTNPNGGKDWAQVRAANGHPAPYDVKWWEVGNETDINPTWLQGVPASKRAAAYAFGGTGTFANQQVGKQCTRNPADSRSDGSGGQHFYAYYPPVMPQSLSLTVAGQTWTQISDLAAAGPEEHVYALDAASGRITFGDGIHGAIPPSGAEIRVSYTSGPHAGYVDFYDAMKKVDPGIKVCWSTINMDYSVLGNRPVDCVESHPYSGDTPGSATTTEDWHDSMMQVADARAAQTGQDQAALKAAHPNADLAVTEYALWPTDQDPTQNYQHSLDSGLYDATYLLNFIQAGIPLAENEELSSYDLNNLPQGVMQWPAWGMSAFGFYPTWLPQAPADVINLFSHMTGTHQVATDVKNDPTRVPTNVDLAQYPALRVGASTDADGRLELTVVNRDPVRDISATVLPKRYLHEGSAEVWTVNGDSTAAVNSPDHPNAVSLTKKTIEVQQGAFDYTFPAHSVTAIRLTSAAQVPTTVDTTVTPSTVEATGQTVHAAAEISNHGDTTAAGALSVIAPAGWNIETPPSYNVAPGHTQTVPLTITTPPKGAAADVGLVAWQHGQIADTAWIRFTTPPPIPTTFVDDADPSVTYTGPWSTLTGQDPTAIFDGTLHYTNVAGATVTIPWHGGRAQVEAISQNNYETGSARVWVDGVDKGTISWYVPQVQLNHEVVYDTGPLPVGDHTIKLEATGESVDEPTVLAHYVNVDDLRVLSYTP